MAYAYEQCVDAWVYRKIVLIFKILFNKHFTRKDQCYNSKGITTHSSSFSIFTILEVESHFILGIQQKFSHKIYLCQFLCWQQRSSKPNQHGLAGMHAWIDALPHTFYNFCSFSHNQSVVSSAMTSKFITVYLSLSSTLAKTLCSWGSEVTSKLAKAIVS